MHDHVNQTVFHIKFNANWTYTVHCSALLFKGLWTVRFLKMFFREFIYAIQGFIFFKSKIQ